MYNELYLQTKLPDWLVPKLCPTLMWALFFLAGRPERTPVATELWSLVHWYHIVGLSLFVWASVHQHRCHKILANLRTRRNNSDHSYHLPKGDWFEYVSSPHYLAEVLIYMALLVFFAATDWGTNWWLVVAFTTSTLLLSARQVHLWYKLKFKDHPTRWKIIIPGLYWYRPRKTNVCYPGSLIPRFSCPQLYQLQVRGPQSGNEALCIDSSQTVVAMYTYYTIYTCRDLPCEFECTDIAFSGHAHLWFFLYCITRASKQQIVNCLTKHMISASWNVHSRKEGVLTSLFLFSILFLVLFCGHFTAWQALLRCLVTGRISHKVLSMYKHATWTGSNLQDLQGFMECSDRVIHVKPMLIVGMLLYVSRHLVSSLVSSVHIKPRINTALYTYMRIRYAHAAHVAGAREALVNNHLFMHAWSLEEVEGEATALPIKRTECSFHSEVWAAKTPRIFWEINVGVRLGNLTTRRRKGENHGKQVAQRFNNSGDGHRPEGIQVSEAR